MALDLNTGYIHGRMGIVSTLNREVRLNNARSLEELVLLSGLGTPKEALQAIVDSGFVSRLTDDEKQWLEQWS